MPIKATTTIDYETYRKYYLFSFSQGTRSPWQSRILLALSPLLAIVFLVLYLMRPADLINLIGMIIMLFMGLVLILIINLVPKRNFKSVEKLITIPNHYVFQEEQMEVSAGRGTTGSKSGGAAGRTATTAYSSLYKVYETSDTFYIYLSRSQSCIVGKQDFTAGTAADLHNLLSARLGDRFEVTKSARKLYAA